MFINTYQILPYMDIRNVQKTGNMFYVYLPTSWCRKYNIKSNSKVTLLNNNDGSLGVFPHITEKKLSPLNIDLNEDDLFIINKLLVAAYINPTSSFKINLTKPVDIEKMLDQKKLLSIAMVEYDGKHLSCESSITIDDPISLLKTMIRKVKNLILLLKKSGDSNLLNIYEDEVDRSKLLIEKSIIRLPSQFHALALPGSPVMFFAKPSCALQIFLSANSCQYIPPSSTMFSASRPPFLPFTVTFAILVHGPVGGRSTVVGGAGAGNSAPGLL